MSKYRIVEKYPNRFVIERHYKIFFFNAWSELGYTIGTELPHFIPDLYSTVEEAEKTIKKYLEADLKVAEANLHKSRVIKVYE